MSKQRDKGTKFETEAARWLTNRLGVEVRRNPLMASLDQGDLFGVFCDGKPFIFECKNCNEYEFTQWLNELDREMECADSDVGCVLYHINHIGLSRMGEQGVLMKISTFFRILGIESEGMDEQRVFITLEALCLILERKEKNGNL